jgi:hypothetical protein
MQLALARAPAAARARLRRQLARVSPARARAARSLWPAKDWKGSVEDKERGHCSLSHLLFLIPKYFGTWAN